MARLTDRCEKRSPRSPFPGGWRQKPGHYNESVTDFWGREITPKLRCYKAFLFPKRLDLQARGRLPSRTFFVPNRSGYLCRETARRSCWLWPSWLRCWECVWLRRPGGRARLPAGSRFAFGDSESYWTLGQAIARGESYQYGEGMHVFRVPGYPVALAGLFRVVGHDPPVMWARALGAVLGTVSVAVVMILARLLYDVRAARHGLAASPHSIRARSA